MRNCPQRVGKSAEATCCTFALLTSKLYPFARISRPRDEASRKPRVMIALRHTAAPAARLFTQGRLTHKHAGESSERHHLLLGSATTGCPCHGPHPSRCPRSPRLRSPLRTPRAQNTETAHRKLAQKNEALRLL